VLEIESQGRVQELRFAWRDNGWRFAGATSWRYAGPRGRYREWSVAHVDFGRVGAVVLPRRTRFESDAGQIVLEYIEQDPTPRPARTEMVWNDHWDEDPATRSHSSAAPPPPHYRLSAAGLEPRGHLCMP
jgi:hypothetical protein